MGVRKYFGKKYGGSKCFAIFPQKEKEKERTYHMPKQLQI